MNTNLSKIEIREISRDEMIDYLSNVDDPTNRIPSRITAFGGYIDGELISVVCLYKGFWHTTEIRGLHVKKEYRKQGIGTQIVSHALKYVDTPVVMATVKSGNRASEKLFFNLGFIPCVDFINPNTGNEVTVWIRRR